MKKSIISICIPVYKGSAVLQEAIESILDDSFKDYELIICDDTPPALLEEREKIKKLVKGYKNKAIRFFRNRENLGAQKNIQKLFSLAKSSVVVYLCQDDIFINDSLSQIASAFKDKSVGIVTRPYYWFDKSIDIPIRAETAPDNRKNTLITINTTQRNFTYLLNSLGQISGLAYRKDFLTVPFHDDIFPGHIYPFLGIFKDKKCVFLKDYTVAVRTATSQTRTISSLYDKSPTLSWLQMFNSIFSEKKYSHIKKWGINHITSHYEGLVQLKNFAKKGVLEREIVILITNNWRNLYRIRFWLYTTITLLMPKKILISLTDMYKKNILSKRIRLY